MKTQKQVAAILRDHGATDLEDYFFLHNHGVCFSLDGIRFDARYWANCYGVSCGCWDILFVPRSGRLCTIEEKASLLTVREKFLPLFNS